jgi:hypothetical protein
MCKPIRTPSVEAKGFCEMIARHEFDFFVTLATNSAATGKLPYHPSRRDCSELEATRKLYLAWEARVLRELLGTHWQLSPFRFGSFAVIEKPEVNAHIHVLLQNRAERDSELHAMMELSLHHFAEFHWRRLVPAGTYDIQNVKDLSGLSEYISKEIRRPEHSDRVILPSINLH